MICSLQSADKAKQTAADCERLRRDVAAACGLQPERWTPCCQVILHADAAAYLGAAGKSGAATTASALTQRDGARVTLRQIDVRADVDDFLTNSLPHELCHVLLADRLSDVPLWCDEGLALLQDPIDKQQRHERDLRVGARRDELLPLAQLLELRSYPASSQWNVFYGQSVSLVRYLLQRGTPSQLLSFAALQRSQGTNIALRDVYGLSSVTELNRQWVASLTTSRDAPLMLIGFAKDAHPLLANAIAD